LEREGRDEELHPFLIKAATKFELVREFPLRLARLLERGGDWQRAMQCLEGVVLPSCSGGQCGPGGKHPASIRALIGLYLTHDVQLKRVGELLGHLEQALGGKLAAADYRLMADYQDKLDNPKLAERARQVAQQMEERGIVVQENQLTKQSHGPDKALL
jgi:hypothetical protein